MTTEVDDIELFRLAMDAYKEQAGFETALQRIEQRLVDLRAVIEQYRRNDGQRFGMLGPNPVYARFYFTWEELEGMCEFIDLEIDAATEWGLLNSFRTAFREGQYGLRRPES